MTRTARPASILRRRDRLAALAAVGLVAATALAGCSASTATPTPTATDDALTGTITVFAAASLADSFQEIADAFTALHPGVEVVFSFAGSSDLATQLVEGAPADVFAAANQKTMTTVTDAGLADGDPVAFATNVLEIAVPVGNPAGITDFVSLAGADVRLVICAEQVPCGAATLKVEQATGVTLTPVSEENAVTDVLGKVVSGEADAGLVYATDVLGAGDTVEGIPFDEASAAVNTYPIVPLAAAANPDAAAAFAAFVLSADGQAILAKAGFGAP